MPMLFFFLQHVAVECVIFIRVFDPRLCSRYPGRVLLACWTVLAVVSSVISFNDMTYNSAVEIVSWCAFISDFLTAVSGVMLVKNWQRKRKRNARSSMQRWKQINAEALAGVGLLCHGKQRRY
jgi:purine-cytosine permease-like protein